MSSKSKNFRRRVDNDDDNNEDNGGGVLSKDKPTPNKLSSKPTSSAKPKKPPQKLLSFAEDEEESPFSQRPKSSSSSKLSRHSSSHKILSSKDRLASTPGSAPVPSNVQPQAGQYTQETLLELRKNTKTLASSSSKLKPPASELKTASAAEPVIVLKGSVKPVLRPEKDDGLNDEKKGGDHDKDSLKRDEDDAERRLGLMGIAKEEALGGKDIPDQATINAIRAKRERLRLSKAAAPDYISLDGGSNHGEAEGLSDEEPEFQTRIAMFGEVSGAKKGVFEDVDERTVRAGQLTVEDDDDDEEERKWEEEQFRKGLGKRMDEGTTGGSRTVTTAQSAQPQSYMYTTPVSYSSPATVPTGPPSIGGVIGGLPVGETISISQQAEIAKQALQDNVRRLKETHGRTMSSLARADENVSTSLTNITSLEKSLSAAGEKYIFMQKLRDYISVICDFLQHKAPYIEELEEHMQQLHKKRASSIFERRAADIEDEMPEIQAAVKAAMSVLDKGGINSSTIAAATSAALSASASIRQDLPVELDEYGRDINLQKRMDMDRRAAARQRRRSRSDSKRISSVKNNASYLKIEGESSTDESDNDSEAYKSNRDLLLQTAEGIFSDAAQEYSQLSLVMERFDRCKRLYLGTYRDAYMSLSIPAIFSPYVRLELLKWDPLHEDVHLVHMRWYSLLGKYGVPEDGSDANPDDADADLVPCLVEKVALPIFQHDITHCWDVLSTRETTNAVEAMNEILVFASSEALKELVAAIRDRLAKAVSDLVVPSWSSVIMKAVPNAARMAAYQFGVAIRLMRNICMWKDILAMPILERLVLDELLVRKVLPHVQNLMPEIHDAITRTERIIAALSGVWAGASATGARSRKLQPLVDHVKTLGKMLEKRRISETETTGLARRLKNMLVGLNEYDEAKAILKAFHLKEAL